MRKILCIRFSSIGDIILTSPIVRALKQRYPDAEIHVATKAQFASLWDGNPYVAQVHGYQGNLWKFAVGLRKEGFDAVIDLHKNVRSHLLCLLIGRIPYQINKFTRERKAFVKTKVNNIPNKHLVDRYFDALASLGIQSDGQGLDYVIPADQVLDPIAMGIAGKYAVYAIGAQHITKVLSYPSMVELCAHFQGNLVLIGDDWDEHIGFRLATLFPGKVINLCGKTSIAGSASLMQQAEFVITHDSSMMHIAAALKKKLFVIWGSTHRGFGMYPYQTPFISIENTELTCRPCTTQGTNTCPLTHGNCMRLLDFSPIFQAAKTL